MKSEKFWSRMASNYDKQVLRTYKQTYIDTVAISRKFLYSTDVVLDIGCGTGIPTLELSKCVKEIYAIDTSETMISMATKKARENMADNIHFSVANLFDPHWEKKSFDAIMAFNTLCYIEDVNAFLLRIFDLLKPNGIFLSATDCLGEKKSAATYIQSLLCKAGILPFTAYFSVGDLETVIRKNGFTILESNNLYDKRPNLFVAAQK